MSEYTDILNGCLCRNIIFRRWQHHKTHKTLTWCSHMSHTISCFVPFHPSLEKRKLLALSRTILYYTTVVLYSCSTSTVLSEHNVCKTEQYIIKCSAHIWRQWQPLNNQSVRCLFIAKCSVILQNKTARSPLWQIMATTEEAEWEHRSL